jgi:hypothetical protein
MTDPRLTELLDDLADRVTVGPPPLRDIRAGAARTRRRRRRLAGGAAAVAVAVVLGGTAVVTGSLGDSRPRPAAPTPTGDSSPVEAPPGTRLVGLGELAIAVPEAWGTNTLRCGTPQEDTVMVDVGVVATCRTDRPQGVESVELLSGDPRFDFEADREVEVDGVRAERQDTACESHDGVDLCSGTLYFPGPRVSFRAESSTGAAAVDELLEQVRHLPGAVGVPGPDIAPWASTTVAIAAATPIPRCCARPAWCPGSSPAGGTASHRASSSTPARLPARCSGPGTSSR